MENEKKTHGRPRTIPEDEELVELGKELVEWAHEKTDEWRVRWAEWYTAKGFIRKQWDRMIDTPSFRVYYERAQCGLAKKFLNGTVNQSLAHRFLRIYCPEVAAEEDKVKENDLRIKKEIDKEDTQVVDGRLIEILEHLKGRKHEEK